jgi:hypothetical protein
MSERRRMMMSEKRLLEDGLLFWFDGLNKGTAQSTKWEPYYCNSTLGNFYMNTVGSPTVNNNGYGCSVGNLFTSNINPFIYARNGYTVIICVSDITYQSTANDYAFLSFNRNVKNYQYRGEFFLRGNYSQKPLAIWINGYNSVESSVITTVGSSGCFVFGSDNSKTRFARNDNVSNYICNDQSGSRLLTNDSNMRIFLSNYVYNEDQGLKYTSGVPGNYHALVMYDRLLSSEEIESVTNFLNKRYGI